MRILVGTVEIAGQISIFADGFRQLGHQVTTVIKERHPFYSDTPYDRDISIETLPWPNHSNGAPSRLARLARRNVNRGALLTRLAPLIRQHDVFVFQWAGTSLTEHNREFPVLKRLGKKIVSLFCGSDVRHSSGYGQLFSSLLSEDSFVDWHTLREDFAKDPLSRPLRDMRVAEIYSDIIISAPSVSILGVRPYMHFFVPVKLSEYQAQIPRRDVPVIVHAPSDKGVKGTEPILSALERLRTERVPFELHLLHGVPHSEVVSAVAKADIVIDQLYLPTHGMFGLEGMASGCALATCNREEYEPFPPHRPIWHIDAANLYSQLRHLLTDKDLRIRLAGEGRKYVEQYHDHVKVASRILAALSGGTEQQYDHYPSFFTRAYQLPDGVVIPEDLKQMTAKIVERWGLPEGVDPQELISRGLMSANGLIASRPIPRWNAASIHKETVVE